MAMSSSTHNRYRYTWDEAFLDVLTAGHSACVELDVEFEHQPGEPRTWDYPGSAEHIYVTDVRVVSVEVYDEFGDVMPFELSDDDRRRVLAQFWDEHTTDKVEAEIREYGGSHAYARTSLFAERIDP